MQLFYRPRMVLMKFTRINDFLKLFVVIFAIVSLISVSLISCGGGGGGGGGGASGPAGGGSSDGSDSSGGSSPSAPTTTTVLSSNADMISFAFTQADNSVLKADLSGTPQTVNDVSTATVYYHEGDQQASDFASLKPTIEVSAGASISPASGEVQDFTSPVEYTVTAQDGTTKIYTVSISQIDAGQYRIYYDYGDGVYNGTTPAPEVFKDIDHITLPGGGNVTKPNNYFAGWMEQENMGQIVSGWNAGGRQRDVHLIASWEPAPYIEGNRIFANGIPVTVKGIGNTTMVSFISKGREINLSEINSAAEYQNLTGYSLFAGGSGNINNTGVSTTDCTITMNGGTLSNIYGYNGNGTNLVGSGNVTIQLNGGTVTTDVVGFVRGAPNQPANVAVKVSGNPTVGDKTDNGIWLNSFTSPVVTLTGSISSASAEAITLIAAGATQNGTHVAESASGDYADAGKFKLLNSNHNSSINVGKNGSYVVVIGSVSLPEVPIWGNGDAFTLGDGHVLEGGTYFSVFVDGGYFTVPSTTLSGAQFDMAIPYSTDGTVTYIDGSGLSTEGQYQYIQFKSTSGEIASNDADAYLSEIIFHGTSVKVSVNLQTVPFDEIQSSGVTYFNGSFYKVVTFPGNDKSWDTAYEAAKASVFNGLHGYLMTITSHVENKFIYDRVYAKNPNITPAAATGWIGATRGINKSGNYDAATWTFNIASDNKSTSTSDTSSLRADWYWACGPEAGQKFYNKRQSAHTGSGRVDGWYSSWNNPTDMSTNGIGSGGGAEPNNSNCEYCAQYVGTYVWNDLSHNKSGNADTYVPGSYIIEYSVYKNAYNEERATSTALADSKTYRH